MSSQESPRPTPESTPPIVAISGLTVSYQTRNGRAVVLDDVELTVGEGEIVALVGESGSGKSTLGLAMLGLLPSSSLPNVLGEVTVAATSVNDCSDAQIHQMRTTETGLVLQDPIRALNPTMRIGHQLTERGASSEDALHWLEQCEVPTPTHRLRQYAFELSGGQAQRVTIAMALAVGRGHAGSSDAQQETAPRVLVVDEPTTALDATTQLEILRLFNRLREVHRCAIVMITHDLAAAARIADRVVVMYAGRICEDGPVAEVMSAPMHRYTQALLAAQSTTSLHSLVDIPGNPPALLDRPHGCAFADRCSHTQPPCQDDRPARVQSGRRVHFCNFPASAAEVPTSDSVVSHQQPSASATSLRAAPIAHVSGLTKAYGSHAALQLGPIDLTVHRGQSLVIVGESGCGKTTLLRALAGLIGATSGSITWAPDCARPQLIHQNFTAALTPWMTIGEQIVERLQSHNVPRAQRRRRAEALLHEVGLDITAFDARPLQLSGGQRQRAVIARALASSPGALLCDEPTSALDASYAVRVVRLLNRIKIQNQIGLVIVTHDISLAPHLGDELIVMRNGLIEESGQPREVIAQPRSEYTKTLVEASTARITDI